MLTTVAHDCSVVRWWSAESRPEATRAMGKGLKTIKAKKLSDSEDEPAVVVTPVSPGRGGGVAGWALVCLRMATGIQPLLPMY